MNNQANIISLFIFVKKKKNTLLLSQTTASFPVEHSNFCWLQFAISPLDTAKTQTTSLIPTQKHTWKDGKIIY